MAKKTTNLDRRAAELRKDHHARGWRGMAVRERELVCALGNLLGQIEAQEEQSDEPEDIACIELARRLYERRSKNLFEPVVIK